MGLACLLLLSIQTAQASSTIDGAAILKYTINNINVSSGSGNLTGLDIRDWSEIFPRDSQSNIPDNLSITDVNRFNKTFSFNSTLNDGSAVYFENALLGLNFLNSTTDTSYDIQVTLDYLLSADSVAPIEAASDQADTSVLLSYFNSDSSFSGADFTASYANIAAQLRAVQTTGSSGVFSFHLVPGEAEVLFADVKITGNLVASPVPVPAAIWLFASTLLFLPGLNRIKFGT